MRLRIVVTQVVRDAIDTQTLYLLQEGVSVDTVSRWLDDLQDKIDGLKLWPRRHPVDEQMSARRGYELRRMLHRHHVLHYRVEDEKSLVEVISFQHAAKDRGAE